MVASAGRNLLLKIGTGSPLTYTTIGGFRANTITLNGTTTDITNMDDAGVRKLLAGAGQSSVTISGNGVFTDSAGQASVAAAVLARTFMNLKLEDSTLNNVAYTGSFQPTSFEHSGEEGGEQTFSMTFESAGAVTITNT